MRFHTVNTLLQERHKGDAATPLHLAVVGLPLKITQTILQNFGYKEKRKLLEAKDNQGMTALHYAATSSHQEDSHLPITSQEYLIDAARETNILKEYLCLQDKEGSTALHQSTGYSASTITAFVSLFRAAREAGILAMYLDIRNNTGSTALHQASSRGKGPEIQILLQKKKKMRTR